MEFGRCDEDYLLHEDCGRVHWHREASVKDSDLLQIRDAEDARRKCLCGLPWGGTGHVSEIYPPTTPHPTVMYGWDEKDVVDQREYPPTTPHPDNPCAQTLIKALTVSIHKLKAYENKETANQPVDKAELTTILAFLREHLKTIQ